MHVYNSTYNSTTFTHYIAMASYSGDRASIAFGVAENRTVPRMMLELGSLALRIALKLAKLNVVLSAVLPESFNHFFDFSFDDSAYIILSSFKSAAHALVFRQSVVKTLRLTLHSR